MLIGGTLISEATLAGLVWRRVSAVTDPLLFLLSTVPQGMQLLQLDLGLHRRDAVISSFSFSFAASEEYVVLGP